MWRHLAKEFSARCLAFDSDRLAALAGIKSTVETLLVAQPLLGLWKSDICEGLTWKADYQLKENAVLSSLNDIPSQLWLGVKSLIADDLFQQQNKPEKKTP